jgi:uncharacterized protein (DUF2141 family)
MSSLDLTPRLRLAFAGILISSLAQAGPAPSTATISANVGPLRTSQGSVACRLYTSGEGFPLTTIGTTTRRIKVTSDAARCVFEKLPPGTYAIMVHHDENDNRKMDKNLLGMPLEGYGASNNRTYALSAPTWDESKFVVEAGKPRTLAIALRY